MTESHISIAPHEQVKAVDLMQKTPLLKEKSTIPESSKRKAVYNFTPLHLGEKQPVVMKKQNELPVFNSDFTKQTSEELARCGINSEYINPTPIGRGANHVVYLIDEPGKEKKVLKLSKPNIYVMTDGHKGESENLKLAQEYFTEKFIPHTTIHHDPNSSFYCVIQDEVKGKDLTNLSVRNNPKLLEQLKTIIQMNNKLFKDKKTSLDFVGVNGFVGWLKKQLGKLILRKSEFPVSNILVDEKGNLKIIDFEFFDISRKIGIKNKVINWFCTTINRVLMKHYFGFDILK